MMESAAYLSRNKIGAVVAIERSVGLQAIIDSGTVIPDGMQIGVDKEADRARFHVTEGGIVLATSKMLRRAAAQAG